LLTERIHRNPSRFDPQGALLLAIGLACLTGALSFGQELGWASLPILAALVVSLISLLLLPFVELRVPNPIIVFSLLEDRIFGFSLLSLVMSFLSLTAVSFILPFYLEQLRHFPTQVAGLLLTPLPLTIAILAPFTGRLSDRIGSSWLAPAGLTIACIGMILLSTLDQNSSTWDIIWPLIVIGAGQAVFQSPNNSTLLGAAPKQLQGSASGFLATGRTFGQSLSVALTGAVFVMTGAAAAGLVLASHSQQNSANMVALQQTFVHGFHITFLITAFIAAIGIVASLVRNK
jgi:MFS family permease